MARKTRGLQINTSVESMADVQRALGQIQAYLNAGVDSVHRDGLSAHPLLWIPTLQQGDLFRVCGGFVHYEASEDIAIGDSSNVTVWFDGRVEAALASTVLDFSFSSGDPRFVNRPVIQVTPYTEPTVPISWAAADSFAHSIRGKTIGPHVLDFRLSFIYRITAISSIVSGSGFGFYWLAFGPGRGGA